MWKLVIKSKRANNVPDDGHNNSRIERQGNDVTYKAAVQTPSSSETLIVGPLSIEDVHMYIANDNAQFANKTNMHFDCIHDDQVDAWELFLEHNQDKIRLLYQDLIENEVIDVETRVDDFMTAVMKSACLAPIPPESETESDDSYSWFW